MSIQLLPDVTTISLIFSIVALAIVVIVGSIVLRSLRSLQKSNNSLDATALVEEFSERQKHVEQKFIDEKIRLEILELRLSKQNLSPSRREPSSYTDNFESSDVRPGIHVSGDRVESSVEYEAPARPVILAGKNDAVIKEILEIVTIGQGKSTAREIQQKIGRSREHTARLMNMLFKRGLVRRDVNSRPFTYSITESGEKVMSEF